MSLKDLESTYPRLISSIERLQSYDFILQYASSRDIDINNPILIMEDNLWYYVFNTSIKRYIGDYENSIDNFNNINNTNFTRWYQVVASIILMDTSTLELSKDGSNYELMAYLIIRITATFKLIQTLVKLEDPFKVIYKLANYFRTPIGSYIIDTVGLLRGEYIKISPILKSVPLTKNNIYLLYNATDNMDPLIYFPIVKRSKDYVNSTLQQLLRKVDNYSFEYFTSFFESCINSTNKKDIITEFIVHSLSYYLNNADLKRLEYVVDYSYSVDNYKNLYGIYMEDYLICLLKCIKDNKISALSNLLTKLNRLNWKVLSLYSYLAMKDIKNKLGNNYFLIKEGNDVLMLLRNSFIKDELYSLLLDLTIQLIKDNKNVIDELYIVYYYTYTYRRHILTSKNVVVQADYKQLPIFIVGNNKIEPSFSISEILNIIESYPKGIYSITYILQLLNINNNYISLLNKNIKLYKYLLDYTLNNDPTMFSHLLVRNNYELLNIIKHNKVELMPGKLLEYLYMINYQLFYLVDDNTIKTLLHKISNTATDNKYLIIFKLISVDNTLEIAKKYINTLSYTEKDIDNTKTYITKHLFNILSDISPYYKYNIDLPKAEKFLEELKLQLQLQHN